MAGNQLLSDYLDCVLQRRRWTWGETDCLMILADWVKLRLGVDPAADIRGTYATEEEALALMVRHRGIVGCIDHCVWPLGIARTKSPASGDFGVVFVPIKRRGKVKRGLTGAICLAPRMWALKTPTGLMACDFQVRAAWALRTRVVGTGL